METIELGIKFARGWEPVPVPDPGTGYGALAQTGDFNVALIAGLILLAMTIAGVIAYVFANNRQLAGALHVSEGSFGFLNFTNFSLRAKVVGALMMILTLACILLGCFSTNAHAADGAKSPLVPDKSEITAKVTKDGTFTLDTCKLTNEGTEKYAIIIEKSSVSIAQDATDIEGLDQTELTINGFGDGKIVFAGKPGDRSEFTPEGLEDLASGASTTLSFAIDLPDDVDIETLLDKQIFTISLTPKQTWIPMQAKAKAESNPIDFYPAFSNTEQIAGYKFATYDGTRFIEIENITSMSNIYSALQPSTGIKTTTLYYKKTSSATQDLMSYTTRDMTWNFVFGTTISAGEAIAYDQVFIDNYQKDGSGNNNGIKTALLESDGFGSKWDQQTDIPELVNDVKYINKQGTDPSQIGGFYGCYGGRYGGLLSDNSNYPWGCCARDSILAHYFNVGNGRWFSYGRGYGHGVVLARAFK